MKRYVWMLFLLLCVVCVCHILPCEASAAGLSGTCGENATWTFDEESGILTISGTGAMYDNPHPGWGDYEDCVKSLVIEEGITEVYWLYNLKQIVSVTIPKSVYKIGGGAFLGCSQLSSIELHDDITTIGARAFEGTQLEEFTVPKGVTKLENGVLCRCAKLKKVTIHDGVTSIESNAFSYCYMLESIDIPDSVETIGLAFNSCIRLKEIKLSNSLKSITNGTFRDCDKLVKIVIPDSVASIGSDAFGSCDLLEEITIGTGMQEVAHDAFYKSPKFKKISISEENPYLYCDSYSVIYNKEKTKLLVFPPNLAGTYKVIDGVTEIAPYAAADCTEIKRIILPDSIKVIGQYAFSGCTNLERINLPEGFETVGLSAFSCTSLSEITFPKTLREIKTIAFWGCKELKKIVFLCKFPKMGDTPFSQVDAIAYYPYGDGSWTDYSWRPNGNGSVYTNNLGLYGGLLEWKAICVDRHGYGEWEEIQAPTAQMVGVAERKCSNCGKTEKKELDRLADNVVPPAESQPTDTTPTETVHEDATLPAGKSDASIQNQPGENAPEEKNERMLMFFIIVAVFVIVSGIALTIGMVIKKADKKP